MKSADLLALFRADVADRVAPYLWSDEEIVSYMDDAQKMFCRLTGGIREVTADMCFIDIEVGEPFATIDARILRITRIQRDSDSTPIDIVNVEDLDSLGIKLDRTRGVVRKVVVGMQPQVLRWVSTPALNDSASMVVERLPLAAITEAVSTKLEIDEQHQRHLMLWMKSLAYAKQDADTIDRNRAVANDAMFRAYCAEASAEKARARHKTRIVRYGGL